MASPNIELLHSLIDQAVHTNGPLGKTTAPGLNALLHRLTTDLAAAGTTALPADLAAALAAANQPSATNPIATSADLLPLGLRAFPHVYAELAALAQQQQLVTGAGYLLTDYATHYLADGTNTVQQGAPEPLLLLASGPGTFAVLAASATYPTDVLYYSFGDSLSEDGRTPRPGRILYRQDPATGQSAYYDWRTLGLPTAPSPASAASYGTLQFTAGTDGAQVFALPGEVSYACLFDVAVIEQPAQLVRPLAQPDYTLHDQQKTVACSANANLKQGDVLVLSYVTAGGGSGGSSSGAGAAYSKAQSDQRYSPLGTGAAFANSHYNRVKLTHSQPVGDDYAAIMYDTVVAGSAIANGVFTAPEAGLWCFATTTLLQGNQGQWYLNGYYRRDGVEVDKFVEGTPTFAAASATTYVSTVYLYLRAGQQLTPVLKAGQNNATTGLNVLGFGGDGEYSSFTAFLLFPATVAGVPSVCLDFAFNVGFANSFSATVSRSQAVTYTAQALSNVASVVYARNGEVVSLPFTLAPADTLLLTITRLDEAQGAVVSITS